ncbi:aldo/keto reductase [Brevibacillus migulae]|uniref:aldo/keto reductase n=1 Tax=Brevibacillus migulae TaxID=1644114 RepID=UPI00106E57E1|nr:aldo/keto reductase [Brevibacillus migulae]
MKYRKLGKTGLEVSVIGLGTWQFGGEWGKDFTQQEVDQILGRGQELGINLIDTAECYGDHLSEKLIGNAIRGKRSEWILATKFGHHYHGFRDRTDDYGAGTVQKQLEDSLRALQTDYIDLYQFHSGPNEAFDQDDLWTMLQKQVEAGKIRHLGISIAKNDNLHQTDAATRVGAGAIQVVYNRLDQTPDEGVFPSCQRQNLGVLARVPLASGYLSGKYKPGAVFAENDVRNRHDQAQTLEKLQRVAEIQQTEVPEGVNMAQWALAWCLQHPAVTCVIPGCKDVAQVEANAKAADLEMVRDNHPYALNRQ